MDDAVQVKRKLRELKKFEIKLRFGGAPASASLVWDALFDLGGAFAGKAKYPLAALAAMDRETFQVVLSEFYLRVYEAFYRENGIEGPALHDAELLARLGLPWDADDTAIKKRFHELAMKHHPDAGGDAGKFVELMENYRALIEKGK